MGILAWIKVGAVAVGLLTLSYFTWNYKHMQVKLQAQAVQIAEQTKVIAWYEKAAKIDKDTEGLHNEINKAAEANDLDRMHELFDRLRQHQRLPKSATTGKTNDAGHD